MDLTRSNKEILYSGYFWAHVAQSVERVLGKDEVTGSSPVAGFSIMGQNLRV